MVKKFSGAGKSSQPTPPRPAASGSSKTGAGVKAEDEGITANDVAESSSSVSVEEIKAQQRLLNIFNDTFRSVLGRDDFTTILQEVKGALYKRDFETAFGSEHFLDVYAARYSPPRALCYARVLAQISGHMTSLLHTTTDGENTRYDEYEDEVEMGRVSPTVELEEMNHKATSLRMLAIGGGAAEIVAFAEHIRNAGPDVAGDLTLLDVGPWQDVVQKLHTGLTTLPTLSKYASATAKVANAALVSPVGRLKSVFVQQDVLSLDGDGLTKLLDGKTTPLLVTMLFTLNELYTTGGVGKTTAFLRNLTATVPIGSLLLVVDSPGSYSETAVGKEAKRYPMQWLLHHTLLQDDKLPRTWEKLESHDSVWFRHPEGLRYPIELHDMRYQMHLYRVCPQSSD